jgi:hypothetical protein
MLLRHVTLSLACSLLLAPVLGAGQLEVEGYQAPDLPVAGQGAFLGGFDVMANGHYVLFDGTDVIEVDPVTGQTLGTLFTPPSGVFGSFVRVAPDGQSLYFGESTNGVIYKIPAAGGSGTPVTTLAFNYDMEFDPSGRAFVSAASGAFDENFVHLLDLASGQTDVIVHIPSFSGPIIFDPQGNLYVGQPDDQFPPRPDRARVLLYTKAQVDSAIGPTELGEGDGQNYVDQLQAINDMDFDGEGDLFLSDAFNGFLIEVKKTSGQHTTFLDGQSASIYTYVRYRPGTQGLFEPFQPPAAGSMLAIEFPFSGGQNDVVALQPRRPDATTSPSGHIPPGPFTFAIEHAPANGAGVLLVADQTAGSELPIVVNGIPLFIGIDLATFRLLLTVPFDGNGTLTVNTQNPGLGGVTLAVQAVAGHNLGQLLGTSNALSMTLD